VVYLVCTILFWVGLVGLTAQALLGGFHVGHAGHHGGTHSGNAHAAHNSASGHSDSGLGSLLLTILSPMTIFSVCLGAGAAGLLVRNLHLAAGVVALIAIAGGSIFYGALVRPLFALLLNFASTPSKALEGTVAQDAEVITAFDEAGRGLVQLTIDGQLVRVLATLEADDHVRPSDISPGDKLTVTSVDGHSNTCRVARL